MNFAYYARLDEVVLHRAAMSSPLLAMTRERCSRLFADEAKGKGIQEIRQTQPRKKNDA